MSKTITVSDEIYKKIEHQVLEDKNKIEKKEKKKFQIKNRFTGRVIYESEKTTYRDVLEEANLEEANLEEANLEEANLEEVKTISCVVNFVTSEYEQAKQFIEGLKC